MIKMEKIIIAPGESGDFNNWGKDFLEEKAFLEKFSCSYAAALMILKMKCVFANYCINRNSRKKESYKRRDREYNIN